MQIAQGRVAGSWRFAGSLLLGLLAAFLWAAPVRSDEDEGKGGPRADRHGRGGEAGERGPSASPSGSGREHGEREDGEQGDKDDGDRREGEGDHEDADDGDDDDEDGRDAAAALGAAKISLAEAVLLAERKTGGRAVEAELEMKGGAPVFEVDTVRDGVREEVLVSGDGSTVEVRQEARKPEGHGKGKAGTKGAGGRGESEHEGGGHGGGGHGGGERDD